MKTNHAREYVAPRPRYQGGFRASKRLQSGRGVGACISWDFTDGHRGMARAKRGAKKRLRGLDRRDARQVIEEQLAECE